MPNINGFTHLPTDLQNEIVQRISPKSLLHFGATSKDALAAVAKVAPIQQASEILPPPTRTGFGLFLQKLGLFAERQPRKFPQFKVLRLLGPYEPNAAALVAALRYKGLVLDEGNLFAENLLMWRENDVEAGCPAAHADEAVQRIRAARSGAILNLSHLDIRSLPACVSTLTGLAELRLQHCRHLEALPQNFGNLQGLLLLSLGHCVALQELPPTTCHLKALRLLELRGCTEIRTLPEGVANLPALRHFPCEGSGLNRP